MDESLRGRPIGQAWPSAPAGWYPDVERPDGLRYWNGSEWTEDRAHPQWRRASSAARWSMVAISAVGTGLLALGTLVVPDTPDSSDPNYYCSDEYVNNTSMPASLWLMWLALLMVGVAAGLVKRWWGPDDRLMTWLARLGIASVVLTCPAFVACATVMDCGL